MEKLEGKVVDIYESILCLLEERKKLRHAAEKLHDSYHMKAIDICDRLVNDAPTQTLNSVWVTETRRRLLKQLEEKVESECRARAWCLSDVLQTLEDTAAAEYIRHDAEAEAKKEYVDQYTINLIMYAVRVGKYPEELIKKMGDYQQTEYDLNMKLSANFRSMEKERLEQERVMYNCALAGESICKWVDEHIRRCGHWCQEREKLYYEIRDKRKRYATMQTSVQALLNAVYAGRNDFMVQQMSYVKHIVLRAKRERELMHTKTIMLLGKPNFKLTDKN